MVDGIPKQPPLFSPKGHYCIPMEITMDALAPRLASQSVLPQMCLEELPTTALCTSQVSGNLGNGLWIVDFELPCLIRGYLQFGGGFDGVAGLPHIREKSKFDHGINEQARSVYQKGMNKHTRNDTCPLTDHVYYWLVSEHVATPLGTSAKASRYDMI